MKKISTLCMIVIMLFIFSMKGYTQSDVTNLVLKNAGFDENIQFKVGDVFTLTTSHNNAADYYQMQDVEGWDHALDTSSGINACGATYEYGSQSTINNVTPPTTNYNGGTDGGCLGLSSGWTAQVGYAQNVVLPPGSYTIEYAVYDNNPSATAGPSLFGWIPDGGTAIMTTKTSFAEQTWETDAINFTLTDIATGKIQIGLGSANVSSNNEAKIFIDYVQVICTLDMTTLQAIYEEGTALYASGPLQDASDLKAALDAYAAVSGQTDFSPELFNAAIQLCTEVKYVRDINQLLDLLDEAEALTYAPGYDQTAQKTLEAVYTIVDNAFSDGTITIANIQDYLDQLNSAVNLVKASYMASVVGLKVHYLFDNVNGNVVANASDATGASGVNFDGTLQNDASIVQMGTYKVLSLGNGTGYLDMGPLAGSVLPYASNFTVSVYYRVDKSASLSGNGYFLWSFASSNNCSQSIGSYAAYRLNSQDLMLTKSGYGSETSLSVGTADPQDGWHNVVYRQTANKGELIIDGTVVQTVDTIPIPSDLFAATLMPYNWIGKSPFTSDNYLKNTLVYDFRFYNQAVPDPAIAQWAAVIPDLNYQYNYGTVGDFLQLSALIAQYNDFLSKVTIGDGVGQYPDSAKSNFVSAIDTAQALVDANIASQYLIDEEVSTLTAAYNTFLSSVGSAAVYPSFVGETAYNFEPGQYYIEVGDYYLTVPENGVSDTYLQLREYIDNPDKLNNNQVWNIQYNRDYSVVTTETMMPLYSLVSDSIVWDIDGTWHFDELGRMKKGDTPTAQGNDDGQNNWSWRCHQIYFNGTAYCITGNQNGTGTLSNALTFPTESLNETATNSSPSQKLFNVIFRSIDDVVANPKFPPTGIETPKAADNVKIFGGQGEIVVSGIGAGNVITVYDISGRTVKSLKANSAENRFNMVRGMYIVRVSGPTPSVGKVIVR